MTVLKVPYLKADRGRWFYRRRVPQRHHKTLGFKMWNEPCGDVSDQRAVALVTGWTERDDALIARLDNPDTAKKVRYATEVNAAVEPIMTVATTMDEVGMVAGEWSGSVVIEAARVGIRHADEHPETDPAARLVAYKSLLMVCFGPHIGEPDDADERDEFAMLKRMVERRIADLDGDPNTLSSVSVKYFTFKDIKPMVQSKYRRNIKKLIDHVGDIPIGHLTSKMLREFRDAQFTTMNASSLHSVFTPIKGMLRYAVQEEIIANNPYGSIELQKDKRSIGQRKRKRFTPEEAQRVFAAMDEFWGKPLRGVSDERRIAVWWAVRVQAFTAMRPKEVVWLEPHNVSDKWIKIEDSKTVGSERVIPLHPELKGFPAFIHSGGFDTFKSQDKDRVQTVRHNFNRLTRDFMDPPITDPRKVLYSWRTSFSNSMRCAGANNDMRRSILGHRIAGSLAHYDDGPEFFEKRKWVTSTDPRTEYPDPGDDDDLD